MFGQGGGQTGWSAALFASLAFDNAIDERAARTKGIKSPVAGKADILVVPDLEAGNMLAKQLTFMAGAAGIVLGARAPIVLTSRADGPQARLASCAVAVLFAEAPTQGRADSGLSSGRSEPATSRWHSRHIAAPNRRNPSRATVRPHPVLPTAASQSRGCC